jgi:hypothetical protein
MSKISQYEFASKKRHNVKQSKQVKKSPSFKKALKIYLKKNWKASSIEVSKQRKTDHFLKELYSHDLVNSKRQSLDEDLALEFFILQDEVKEDEMRSQINICSDSCMESMNTCEELEKQMKKQMIRYMNHYHDEMKKTQDELYKRERALFAARRLYNNFCNM